MNSRTAESFLKMKGMIFNMKNKLTQIVSNRYMKHVTVIVVLLTLLVVTSAYNYSNYIQKDLASSLIRLHVIANSNSKEDQSVKLKVRDAVLKYMQVQSAKLKTTDEAKNIILSNMDIIEEVAENTLKANGFNYEVKTYFGNFEFPTKLYGDIILPAGMYQSLRVVIGKGSGANWWCVMFPPLCFVDASHGVVPDSSKAQLRSSLSDEEYQLVTSTNVSAQTNVKFKFKVVEVFQQSKMRIAGLMGH